MALRVVSEELAAASASIETSTARSATAHAGAAPLITAVVPPAVDPVSLESAAGWSVHGGDHAPVAARGVRQLGRSGVGAAEARASYATGDAPAATSYPIAGG